MVIVSKNAYLRSSQLLSESWYSVLVPLIRVDCCVREFLKEEKHNGPDLNITKMWKDYLEKYDSNFFSLQFGNEKSHHSNHSNHHSSGAPGITGLQSHDQQQQHQQMSQERVAMPSFSGAHPHLSHHVPHAHVHPHHPHQHAHQHHAVAYPNLAQQYQTMQVMASNLGLLDHQNQHQQQQQQALYGSHPNHNPHSGGREGEQQLEQPPPPQPTQPPPHTETSKVDKPKGPKPIVKHWLYSKTFHDEFKFQDFLSLKKKLWMLKEDKAQNPQLKTERKQKSPKKISREKELALHAAAVQHTISSNTNQSVSSTTSSHHLAPAPPPVQHQQPPDMYILPVGVGLQDLSTADMLQQQHHAMQLNLHTFSAQSNVLSPIITATGQVLPQSSGTSVVTLPAATMSLAQNSCNYMNVNSAAFYQ
uniref:Uncharacterized protein n=1 Tax=Timema douglasi TaxID=61478 RepID=A0A7R8ZCD3_TIMDO|nr:unnamed protein product [Timema douglasi]